MEKKATREAYGEKLLELGEKIKDLVVLDADLSQSTKTDLFAKKYPERFFNLGIAEQNMMGTAAGLALSGKTVFASSFAIFAAGRAWEQIRNSICYPALNVKICATHAGISVGEDGASHQTTEDLAFMRVLPNMKVFVPADAVEAGAVIEAAARLAGPVYVRLGRPKVDAVYQESFTFQPGRANCLREGRSAAVMACGLMVREALLAAEQLAGEGLEIRVINMSSLKPLDESAIIKAAWETGAIVTAEEHSLLGGLGSAVAEVVAGQQPVPVEYVGIKDRFGQSGSAAELLQAYGLTAADIVQALKRVISRKAD